MVRDLLKATAQYLRENPQEVVKTAVNAAGLKFGVPIAALSWLAAQVKGKKAPKDIELGTVPPALRLGATVDAMGTQLRAAASIKEQQRKWQDAITLYQKLAATCPDLKAMAEDRIRKIRVENVILF